MAANACLSARAALHPRYSLVARYLHLSPRDSCFLPSVESISALEWQRALKRATSISESYLLPLSRRAAERLTSRAFSSPRGSIGLRQNRQLITMASTADVNETATASSAEHEFDPLKTPTLGGTVQRAVQVTAFAGPKRYLEKTRCVTDKPKPQLAPGEVLVRLRVRPVNPSDGLALMGIYGGFQPKNFPATPGNEGMGVIDELGEGVDGFEIGQRVVPLLSSSTKAGEGSWQEYVKIPAHLLVPVPDTVSDEAAAQLVVNPITAYGMLKDFDPPKGAFIIQSAAGSAVGRIVIALAKQWGFKTLNLVRRKEQVEELKALGADEVICTADEDVVRRVKEITGGQLAYGGIDTVAGGSTKLIVNSVRDGGVVFALGGFSAPDCTVPVGDLIFRGVVVHGWWLSRFFQSKSGEEKGRILKEVMGFLESKLIDLPVGEKFDLADYEKALKKQQEAGRKGKVMLVG